MSKNYLNGQSDYNIVDPGKQDKRGTNRLHEGGFLWLINRLMP